MTTVRPMTTADLPAVAAIFASRRGESRQEGWSEHLDAMMASGVALVAEADDQVVGYVTAAVRGWEFGTSPAGWILGIGVDAEQEGQGVASALLQGAATQLRAQGVSTLRTMVRRNDVPILRLFRSAGFIAGPYTELERNLRIP